MAVYTGDSGDNTFAGGAADDYVDVSQGGDDTVSGGDGGDNFVFGASFTAADHVDGGPGQDHLQLQGTYTSLIVFDAATMTSIEDLVLDPTVSGPPASYALQLVDANIAAGTFMQVGAQGLTFFDDRAETDGSVLFESFVTGNRALLGAGNDEVDIFTNPLSHTDRFNGGAGHDKMELLTATKLDVHRHNMEGFEQLQVDAGVGNYDLTFSDKVVVADASLTISTFNTSSTGTLHIDASREKDGLFHVTGAAGADQFLGGHQADVLSGQGGDDVLDGGAGADQLTGGTGSDTFVYASLGDSLTAKADLIIDLDNTDVIDLSGIDADTARLGDQQFHLVGQFHGHARDLTVNYDAGSDLTTIAGDVDGDGKADFAITASGDHTDFTNFVL